MSGTLAWDLPADVDEAQANSSRLLDLILFTLIALPTAVPVLGLPLPETASIALIGLASLRRPSMPNRRPTWFPVLLVALILMLTASSVYNGVTATRRLGHMAIYVLLALTLSSGRVHRLAAVRGLGVGLGIGIVSGVLNAVVPIFGSGYGGRLTGLFHDPNVAGYQLTVLGALALTGARHGPRRWVGILALAAAVWFTLSRTSLIAMALGALWLLLRRLGSGRVAIAATALAAWGASTIPSNVRLWGPFASREGSDELRGRILDAEQVLLHQHLWVGNGAGTSRVVLGPDQSFFFHSSYLGLRNEAGWVGLAIMLALVGLVLYRLVSLPQRLRHPWHEASLIMLALVAMSLGEVLLEMPAAIALGLGMRHVISPMELWRSDRTASPDHIF